LYFGFTYYITHTSDSLGKRTHSYHMPPYHTYSVLFAKFRSCDGAFSCFHVRKTKYEL